jgi:protoporphyrinogen oxidase
MPADISRKSFLGLLAGALALFSGALWFRLRRKSPPTAFQGPAMKRGHALRTPFVPGKSKGSAKIIDTAIIGAGVSGLSAAWYLQKKGHHDYCVFELEDRVGGNSQWGENRLGRYPWGAHYLPTPGPDAHYVLELLQEMGVHANGRYGSEFQVHEPEERLFIYGTWQNGLIPLLGARHTDRQQITKFFDLMAALRDVRGRDGRRAFTIPLASCSKDPRYLTYDKLTADAYLTQHNITSTRLLWYIDYVLRDEYGSNRGNTSAWALIHYFTARSGSHEGFGKDKESVNLVWPEGNGFITEYLRKKSTGRIQTGMSVRRIDKTSTGYILHFENHQQSESEAVAARNVIFAAPKFILPYVYPALSSEKTAAAKSFTYSPWLTANLLVNHFGQFEPAWDNVTFGSRSLGYVVAEHQRTGKLPHARTLTFFHAFDADDTLNSRRSLLTLSESDAFKFITAELQKPHPDIAENIEEVGVYRWAHAMIRPKVGFFSGPDHGMLGDIDRQFYGAHSDVSGMSNFEEAQYQGITAARRILMS